MQSQCSSSGNGSPQQQQHGDPLLDRLTTLENNFTLLLSRGDINPYPTLDEALAAPSRFAKSVDVKVHRLYSREIGRGPGLGPNPRAP
jgi:hypothetical protein